MLTEKQKELLDFIKVRLDKTGVAPSFDEMKVALDLRSKSGIHRLIVALEERGFIRRMANRARAIEIISPGDRRSDPSSQRALVDALYLARSFINQRNYPSVVDKIDGALRRVGMAP